MYAIPSFLILNEGYDTHPHIITLYSLLVTISKSCPPQTILTYLLYPITIITLNAFINLINKSLSI